MSAGREVGAQPLGARRLSRTHAGLSSPPISPLPLGSLGAHRIPLPTEAAETHLAAPGTCPRVPGWDGRSLLGRLLQPAEAVIDSRRRVKPSQEWL